MIKLAFSLASVSVAHALTCESWCMHSCLELNGSPENECGGCEPPNLCRPGEPGFGSRAYAVDANSGTIKPLEASGEGDEQSGGGGKYGLHGAPILQPKAFVENFTVGACDLEAVDHSAVTREMLMSATKPFMIKGMTESWLAHERWSKDEFLRRYGGEPFQLHATSNGTLSDLLTWYGKYHMGHAVYPPGSCYSDPWRPYSPMLLGALKDDYDLPRYLGPMVTFQMGVGSGYGIGVPPENHPSSWFAMVKGRKRWVLNPPHAGTGRNGHGGSEPPGVMGRVDDGGICVPANKPEEALHCDQQEGDVIWVPDYWWHETCGLEEFSIGLGALTYDGCCPAADLERVEDCSARREASRGDRGEVYSVKDIPACASGERTCGGLPYPSHGGLS